MRAGVYHFRQMTTLRQIEIGNRMELLLGRLAERVMDRSAGLFRRRVVCVPSDAIKLWIQLAMAQHRPDDVVAGIDFVHMQQFASQIMAAAGRPLTVPSRLEMALACEDWLERENGVEPSLARVDHADRLSGLLQGYTLAGTQIFQSGQVDQADAWQLDLWRDLFGPRLGWDILGERLREALAPLNLDLELHLFAFPHMQQAYQDFIDELAKQVPVYEYILSPTHLFWSDVRSDREGRWIENFWSERGASLDQQEALGELLYDRNPLLANLGRMGRERALWVEERGQEVHEVYATEACVAEHQHYDGCLPDWVEHLSSEGPITALKVVQADILCMRQPSDLQPLELGTEDDSIQVHSAASALAEVEILYDRILDLCGSEQMAPAEVLVITPDLEHYLPYIELVFAAEDSSIPYAILDVPMSSCNSLLQGFSHLLELARGRWTSTRILQLWENEAFAGRHGLTLDDVTTVRQWIRQVGVHWGYDWEHREEIVRAGACQSGLSERGQAGTWEDAFRELLLGLVSVLPGQTRCTVDLSQSELLGRWLAAMRAVREKLEPLRVETMWTLPEWSTYLLEVFDACFLTDSDDAERIRSILHDFARLRPIGLKLSFTSLHHHLKHAFGDKAQSVREGQLNAVRFGTPLALRGIPARFIAFLGLNNDAYPRVEQRIKANLLAGNEQADYLPHRHDHDRYLFLEILLSVREKLYMSYSARGQEPGLPSLLISELCDYLDRALRFGGVNFREHGVQQHPFHRFAAEYFSTGSRLTNRSVSDFAAASALSGHKHAQHQFLSQSALQMRGVSAENEEVIHLDVAELMLAARNPAALYLRSTCQLRLYRDEWRELHDDEPFHLDPLVRYRLEKEGLEHALSTVLSRAEQAGSLPLGELKRVAQMQVTEQISAAQQFLATSGVLAADIFTLRLSPAIECCTCVRPGLWDAPALRWQRASGQVVEISGQLNLMAPAGLLVLSRISPGSLVKEWPRILLYSLLSDAVPKGEKLLFLRDGRSRALPPVEDSDVDAFIDYTLLCRQRCCPVEPQLLADLFKNPEKLAQRRLEELFVGEQPQLRSDELRWLLGGLKELTVGELLASWQEPLGRVYGELLERQR